jgi:hypothetical protein
VGMPEVAAQCEELLAPLVVVRVANVEEALDRLAAVQPLIACVSDEPDVARMAQLRERTQDVGAVLVGIPRGCDPAEREKLLRRALQEADTKGE